MFSFETVMGWVAAFILGLMMGNGPMSIAKGNMDDASALLGQHATE